MLLFLNQLNWTFDSQTPNDQKWCSNLYIVSVASSRTIMGSCAVSLSVAIVKKLKRRSQKNIRREKQFPFCCHVFVQLEKLHLWSSGQIVHAWQTKPVVVGTRQLVWFLTDCLFSFVLFAVNWYRLMNRDCSTGVTWKKMAFETSMWNILLGGPKVKLGPTSHGYVMKICEGVVQHYEYQALTCLGMITCIWTEQSGFPNATCQPQQTNNGSKKMS
jgi:hypothetical protein